MNLEIRSNKRPVKLEQRDDEGSIGTLSGYISVFDSDSYDLGGFVEQVKKGAFSESLKTIDVVALKNHSRNDPLGRLSAGNLRLEEDETGLRFELDLPDTTTGRDLKVLVGNGTLTGCSFGFTCDPANMSWSTRDGKDFCELVKVELFEVSVGVTFPAYPETSMSLRARKTANRSAMRARAKAKLRLRNS